MPVPEIVTAPYLLAFVAVASYLLGSIPFGLVISKAMGLGDLRQIGSGNIGATNVLRTGSKPAALATLLLDAGKGGIAVLLARFFVGEDAAQLEQMTDVIVRQTNDLRSIADDFSKFARMPEPQLKVADITQLVSDAVSLQQVGQPGVRISADLPQVSILADMDGTMISQALMNLIKNAGEATETYRETCNSGEYIPQVKITMHQHGEQVAINISDNGIGLPNDRARLFEPYVTTRDKGTGLGLPIVKKIIEEHGGTLSLVDAQIFDGQDHAGASAIIHLPIRPATAQATKILA